MIIRLKDFYYGILSRIGHAGFAAVLVFILLTVMTVCGAVRDYRRKPVDNGNAVNIEPDTDKYPRYDYSASMDEASLSDDTAVVKASSEPDTKNVIFPAVFNSAISKNVGSGNSDKGFNDETTAQMLSVLTDDELIELMGPVFSAEQEKTGILASISLAQLIVGSDYSRSELALKSNNVFSMKADLSGNTWSGSAWDGMSECVITAREQDIFGGYYTVDASYRKYPSVRKCIDDHSSYLLGAMRDGKLRYEGIKGCMDYRAAADILKNGGYNTSLTYASDLCKAVEAHDLTRFDL